MVKSRNSLFKPVTLAVLALLMSAGALFAFNLPGLGKSEKVRAVNGSVTIPLAKVADGKAHFFRLSDGGKEIGFFVVRAGDGSIRTAFDACDVCYKEKKGYEQQGDAMLCRNCNKKFAISRIGPHAAGGCNPSYLPFKQVGGNAVFSVADLRTGERFF